MAAQKRTISMKHILPLLLFALATLATSARKVVKVACVGNSVTYGYTLPDRPKQAYPVRLGEMLGPGYDVRNFGHSGSTLIVRGYNPYTKLKEFREAMDFKADIVVIHLGLNDTDPRNWPQVGDDFVPDYRALVDSFRTANPKAKIWLCLMTPIFHDHPRFDSGTREWHAEIQKRIAQVARTTGCGLIDLYTPLHSHPDLFPDALHPNPTGAKILARTVYEAITGNYGGLKLPVTYGDGMVLQRDREFSINGTANAGEKVTVELNGTKRQTTTAANGHWSVGMPSMKAGGPYELSVKAKSGSRSLKDVWIGEVWLCSGQSNMELTVAQTATAAEDIKAADTLSRIHLFNMQATAQPYAVEWAQPVLDSINNLQYMNVKGWQRCSSAAARNFSAIALSFGRMLADSLGCHVGLVSNSVGGSGTEAWIDRATLEERMPAVLRSWRTNDYLMPWSRGRINLNLKKAQNPRQRHPYEPSYLFEAAVAPLDTFPVKGVIWYQGESNAHNIELHERLFTLLEQSWRGYWHQPQMPFYFVQLSSIATRPSWPNFRNSQRLLAHSLPDTWMAVSSDRGDSLNVHPTHKREIGQRLALSALNHTYGHHCTPSGPDYKGFQHEGSSLRLSFDYAGGLTTSDGKQPSTFELAGEDGVYHKAEARIEGSAVIVSSEKVKNPCAVRYGWQPFTRANLVNAAGLPASTFKDEKF